MFWFQNKRDAVKCNIRLINHWILYLLLFVLLVTAGLPQHHAHSALLTWLLRRKQQVRLFHFSSSEASGSQIIKKSSDVNLCLSVVPAFLNRFLFVSVQVLFCCSSRSTTVTQLQPVKQTHSQPVSLSVHRSTHAVSRTKRLNRVLKTSCRTS